MRKDQAIHNEKLCDLLLANGDFSDWVVTAAFYSAVHYLQYEIFPLQEGDNTFNNFSEYFQYKRENSQASDRHDSMIQLSKQYMSPKCSAAYWWLYDACMSARYKDYNVSPQRAQTAKDRLNTFKGCCKKE